MKYCDFNGCVSKIERGRYCSDHKRDKPKKKKSDTASIYHHEHQPFYKSSEWRYLRSVVYEREKGCCQRCGKFVHGRRAHCHHVVPITKNQNLKLDENNIRLLCPQCHVIEENEVDGKKVFASYFNL